MYSIYTSNIHITYTRVQLAVDMFWTKTDINYFIALLWVPNCNLNNGQKIPSYILENNLTSSFKCIWANDRDGK